MAVDVARILAEIDSGRTPAELESQTLEFKQDKRLPEDTERLIVEAAGASRTARAGRSCSASPIEGQARSRS